MEKHLRTTEKKCTNRKCGSKNVEHQGLSQIVSAGESRREPNEHQYKCKECDTVFRYIGQNP